MTTLLDAFLAEARELLEQATEDLLALERDAAPAAALEGAFRAFHTLKGSSALFAFQPMTAALHAAEDLLAAAQATARSGGGIDTRRLADAGLDCLDRLNTWLDAIEAEGSLPLGAAAEAAALQALLHQAMAGEADPPPPSVAGAPPGWIATLAEAERVALRAARPPGEAMAVAISYDPDPGCFLRGEDPLGLLRRLPGLALLRIAPREPWPADPAGLDPFRCNLTLHAIAFAPLAELARLFQPLGGQARLAELAPAALGLDAAVPDAAALLAALLAEQRQLLAAADAPPGQVASAIRVATNALRHAGHGAGAARVAAAADAAAALAAIGAAEALASAGGPGAIPPTQPPVPAPAARSLRVDAARVDRLLGLAEEMVLARNGLLALGRHAEAVLGEGHRPLAQALRDQLGALERLTREWHAAATGLRLLPLDQVFRRFPRLVRELSRELGKPAELRITGAETEADRDLLDRLAEPLLHLMRNSLDHGVEPPEERRRIGKPAVARLALRAWQEADRLLIELADDGRGMDPAVLRRRAVERGLLTEAQAAVLPDAEALRLVLQPGFSTAEAVSTLSGRGVGLDVVRRATEALGGTVAIRSSPGQGTAMRLALPLSLTLLRILMVTAGGEPFGLPLRAVRRTLVLPRARIRRLDETGAAAFALEDRLVPLLPLHRLLGLPASADPPPPEARILLLEAAGQEAGLEVEGFGERPEVVLRPLEGVLAGLPGYLGTTLLGSGRVLLVLDPEGLLR